MPPGFKKKSSGKTVEIDREHPVSKAIYGVLLLLMMLLAVVVGFLGYYVLVINAA